MTQKFAEKLNYIKLFSLILNLKELLFNAFNDSYLTKHYAVVNIIFYAV